MPSMKPKLTHLDDSGQLQMVDVGNKPETDRIAIAKGEIVMLPETLILLNEGNIKKGDALAVADLAGIMAAKRTSELIPLCHVVPISNVQLSFLADIDLPGVKITATVKSHGKTGVEMEALTAVAVAALTIYDMLKAVEKTMRIQNIRLVEKHGGQSGDVFNE